MTKIRLYDFADSTTLESNKSLAIMWPFFAARIIASSSTDGCRVGALCGSTTFLSISVRVVFRDPCSPRRLSTG
jgi:hypothetical protein